MKADMKAELEEDLNVDPGKWELGEAKPPDIIHHRSHREQEDFES